MFRRASSTRAMLAPTLVLALAGLARAAGDGPPLTWDELRALPHDCPIVYDNDWLQDTTDDEYLFAKAHVGRANLRGVVLSKDQWDHGRQYKVQDGRKDFESNLAIVRQSGWRNVPDVTLGAERVLERPASGTIEDTAPVKSAGTDLIVAEARKATPAKPLVVLVGGPLCTVASAYLTDPTIADRMVVMMTDLDGYNGTDPWANFIVATRCKLVNFGAGRLWWPQRPEPPVMPPASFDRLPASPIRDEMQRVASMFWERSTRPGRPDRDDGFADGAGLFLLFRPESWQSVQRVRVNGVWSHQDAPDGSYHYLDATAIDPKLMTEEFFTTIEAALQPSPR